MGQNNRAILGLRGFNTAADALYATSGLTAQGGANFTALVLVHIEGLNTGAAQTLFGAGDPTTDGWRFVRNTDGVSAGMTACSFGFERNGAGVSLHGGVAFVSKTVLLGATVDEGANETLFYYDGFVVDSTGTAPAQVPATEPLRFGGGGDNDNSTDRLCGAAYIPQTLTPDEMANVFEGLRERGVLHASLDATGLPFTHVYDIFEVRRPRAPAPPTIPDTTDARALRYQGTDPLTLHVDYDPDWSIVPRNV